MLWKFLLVRWTEEHLFGVGSCCGSRSFEQCASVLCSRVSEGAHLLLEEGGQM